MNYKELIVELDIATGIVLAIFVLAIIIQFAYYLFVYLRVVLRKKKRNSSQLDGTPPVSVIICARNEEEYLAKNLTSILEQDYPSFEVIVVNYCSEDNTEQLLAELKQKYPHLRSTIIKKDGSFINFKKFAATVGIKAAQHEWLLFTDADCKPECSLWIASMSEHFVENKDIVLGYGGYSVQKGYLNKLIRYDSLFTTFQFFGFALLRRAYMGIERNLAYRKSLFFAHNGFAANAHIISGDNDLFVNKAANKRNVAVAQSNTAYTRSTHKSTFKEWMWQKSKRIISGKHYKNSQNFWLTLEPVSRALMFVTFCVLMFVGALWQQILMIFMLRMIIFMSVVGTAVKRFNEPGILQHVILFDMIMPFVHLHVYILNKISSKHRKWN